MAFNMPAHEKTLAMTVANTGFMVDRLGQDCSQLQYLRELTQNAIEAILATRERKGEIVWDVNWDHYVRTNVYKLCVIDTGCGMTGEEMVRYINALSSSVHVQSHEGNYGVGAKIAAATRNHAGLLYLSWKENVGSMIHLWRDPAIGEYGLRQLQLPHDQYGHWAHVDEAAKAGDEVHIGSHGTKVVLLGNDDSQDTMAAPAGAASPSRWIGRYLNTRYFRFPPGITVKAREGWTNPRADKDRNVLRTITGQQNYLEAHKQASGTVQVSGAIVHWWILKDELALTQNSGFVGSSGHTAALYGDELYETQTGRAGVARLQLFGAVFGYQRVVIYVEPLATASLQVTSNTARTQLLVNNEPLPWADWAAEFRSDLPKAIQELMEEIAAGSSAGNHTQAIRERLKQIRDLLRFSRYRPSPSGELLASAEGPSGARMGPQPERSSGKNTRGGGDNRGGNIYALFVLDEEGQPAEQLLGGVEPSVQWISSAEGTREQGYLEDRAARYLPEQNLLQINSDFRVFTDMIKRWTAFYATAPGALGEITDVTHEWFEQSLIETVMGVAALKGSREWTDSDSRQALSEESLTAAVMPRYHVDVAIRRALGSKLGSIKEKAV